MKRGLRFWINRALRLLPPYYFVCTLTLLANRARCWGRPPMRISLMVSGDFTRW
jgi:hypothetical protein